MNNNTVVSFFLEVLRGKKANMYLSIGRNFGCNKAIRDAKIIYYVSQEMKIELEPLEKAKMEEN
jgi:hypothetical protein